MLATVLINFACLYCTGFGDRLSWVYLNDMQLPGVWGSGSSWHTLPTLVFIDLSSQKQEEKKLIFILIPIGSIPTKLVLLHNSSKIDFVSF